jgi:hypothetical protein
MDNASPLLHHQLVLSQLLAEVQQSLLTTPCHNNNLCAFHAHPGAPFVGKIARTGVYFNNREVAGDVYQSELLHDIQVIKQVPQLPPGKPLSLPPRLKLGPQVMNGIPSSETPSSQGPTSNAGVTIPESIVDNEAVRPKKRSRLDSYSTECTHENKLSEEQQVVVEAAIALAACKGSTVPDQQVKKFSTS